MTQDMQLYIKEQCLSLAIPVPYIGSYCITHELIDHYCGRGIFIGDNSGRDIADHELLHYIIDLARKDLLTLSQEEDICEFFGDSTYYGRTGRHLI